jgi:hypothetical protein
MKKKLCVFLVLVCAILCATFAQSAAADFSGEWNRTDVHSGNSATITIENVTDKSFEFSFMGNSGANTGEIEGTAVFSGKNKAVFDFDDYDFAVKVEFVMDGGKLAVSVVEGDTSGLFGMGVFMDGTYIKGESVYTNAGIAGKILGDNAEKVEKLLGEDAFEHLATVIEDGSNYGTEGLTYSGFIRGAGMGADLLIDGDFIYCLIYFVGDYSFYTNDERYKEELPSVMKENFNDSWDLKFVYKTVQ